MRGEQRRRKETAAQLRRCTETGEDWRGADGALWQAVIAYQGYPFRTLGRGKRHARAVDFSYMLRISTRNGKPTGEILFSNRSGKPITRSSAEMALQKALEVQAQEGCVSGPRKLGDIFGRSYFYAMFVEWGVTRTELQQSLELDAEEELE